MNIYILKAQKSDMESVNRMLTDLIHDEKKYDNNINKDYKVKKYYEQYVEKECSCILVAKNDIGNVIGYSFGYIMDSGKLYNGTVAKLDAIFVSPKYRKKGIAKMLIEYFTKWAKDKGVAFIELTVCRNNDRAVKLYERQGFYTEKLIMKKKL